MSHGYVVEFASKEDRDYYVNEDPAHRAFIKHLEDNNFAERTIAIDYELTRP